MRTSHKRERNDAFHESHFSLAQKPPDLFDRNQQELMFLLVLNAKLLISYFSDLESSESEILPHLKTN
jgi:hypothetical protein